MRTEMWFWVLILGGIAYYFYGGYRPRRVSREIDPLEVARIRYAKGEITLEEYETIKKNLI